MALTKEEKLKAIKISRAIEKHLKETGKTQMRSTDVYEYLARNGLVPRDQGNGIHLRWFLNKLKREGALDLIPQCDAIDQDEIFTNWYFHSAGSKAHKNIVIREEIAITESISIEEALPVIKKLAAGLNPITNEVPNNALFLSDRKVRASLIAVIEHLEIANYKRDYSTIVGSDNNVPSENSPPLIKQDLNIDVVNNTSYGEYDKDIWAEIMEISRMISLMPIIRPTVSLGVNYRMARIRYKRAYEPWSSEEDKLLLRAYKIVRDTSRLSGVFKRGEGSIKKRLEMLGTKI